ncbi:MAG: methyltransferase [Planctomycetota bacterium]|jgi:16S rRNA (guanine1207-N2)-methyltransferase|nr:methyltransferase [Planctomycetota bacterium]MDP7129528.1 methyltransferase [Planctomycetota bacterium]MDP7250177.1 methyltransferase [Planctomycetota bacterium]
MPQIIRIGSRRKAHRETRLLDGELTIFAHRTPPVTDRMLINALPSVQKGRVLTGLSSEPLIAMACKALQSEGEVTFFHLDAFHTDTARDTLESNAVPGVDIVLDADLPVGPFDSAFFAFHQNTEWQLARDILEQTFSALAPGGNLLVATDNPRDSKLAQELQRVFGGVKLEEKNRAGRLYLCRRKGAQKFKRRGYRCTIQTRFQNREFEFQTRPGVFSHAKFDDGARALLDVAEFNPGDSLLDLGCGYGSVGVIMAAQMNGKVTLLDSNARAAALANENLSLNKATNGEVILTATVDAGDRRFDRVLANPPYFSNYSISDLFIRRSHELLNPSGTLQLVTKSPAPHVEMFEKMFGNAEITTRRGYSVVRGIKDS